MSELQKKNFCTKKSHFLGAVLPQSFTVKTVKWFSHHKMCSKNVFAPSDKLVYSLPPVGLKIHPSASVKCYYHRRSPPPKIFAVTFDKLIIYLSSNSRKGICWISSNPGQAISGISQNSRARDFGNISKFWGGVYFGNIAKSICGKGLRGYRQNSEQRISGTKTKIL